MKNMKAEEVREAGKEALAELMHLWYLKATKQLRPESYNQDAQKAYKDLTDEQKAIDRFIAEKVFTFMDDIQEDLESKNTELNNKLIGSCVEKDALFIKIAQLEARWEKYGKILLEIHNCDGCGNRCDSHIDAWCDIIENIMEKELESGGSKEEPYDFDHYERKIHSIGKTDSGSPNNTKSYCKDISITGGESSLVGSADGNHVLSKAHCPPTPSQVKGAHEPKRNNLKGEPKPDEWIECHECNGRGLYNDTEPCEHCCGIGGFKITPKPDFCPKCENKKLNVHFGIYACKKCGWYFKKEK